jgi:CheY-like chemotaxis protein
VFTILLPTTSQEPGRTPPEEDPDDLPRGTETVLLVEDEYLVRHYVAHVLRDRGYNVLEAANGHDALNLARGNPNEEIDVLLTDVVMPLMGGGELAAQLKADRPDLKVLYTSGYTDGVIQCAPVVDTKFMAKPFTPMTLTSKIRQLLQR